MPFYIPEYGKLHIHEMMLLDNIRTKAYQKAIFKNVKKGDVVIDVGAGTGILSLFAVQAGAKRVYAVEPTEIINLAKKIAKDNNLSSRIKFINSKIENADIPEKADCIVSEWLGVFAIQENMLPSVVFAKENFLKKGGKLLPEKVNLYLSLVENKEIHFSKIDFWKNKPYGLNYEKFAFIQANDVYVDVFTKNNLLTPPKEIFSIDVSSIKNSSFRIKEAFKIERSGLCHGFVGWFQAVFPGGVILETTPGYSTTHWEQAFFPIGDSIRVKKNEKVIVELEARPKKELVHFIWELTFPRIRKTYKGDTRNIKFN